MNIKCFLIIVNVLILCIIISISPADTPDSLKASTFSKNISDNYNEKIETQKYSSYSGTTACCPPGRSCEFNPDYESCICNPSDYDPYCMYDGCEEVIVKGEKNVHALARVTSHILITKTQTPSLNHRRFLLQNQFK
jgi:hypothetical protein